MGVLVGGKHSHHLTRFLNEVKQYGYCSIDTEGVPVLVLQMASPKGTVVFWGPEVDYDQWREDTKDAKNKVFRDLNWGDMPSEMQEVLENENIIKIQSAIFTDKKWLELLGFQVNSCIELQLLFRYHPWYDGGKIGMEAMVRKVCGQEYVSIPYFQFWGCERLAKTESGRVQTALK